jgi:hypothetical protein
MEVFTNSLTPVDTFLKCQIAGFAEKAFHDGGFGTSVAHDDQWRGLQQRKEHAHQLRIEGGHFFRKVLVSVLLRLAVEPDNLGALKNVEFPKVVRSSIDLSHQPKMWPLGMQRLRKADVEVCRKDRPRQSSQDQLCQIPISSSDFLPRLDEIEQDGLAIGLGLKQIFDGQREVVREPFRVLDEPRLLVQPGHPFGGFQLLRNDFSAKDSFREVSARHPLDRFAGQRDTRRKRSAGAQQNGRAGLVGGAKD